MTTKTEGVEWDWMSTVTVSVEYRDHPDKVRIVSLSDGAFIYLTQNEFPGIARLSTADMRALGELLIEGADTLEARTDAGAS